MKAVVGVSDIEETTKGQVRSLLIPGADTTPKFPKPETSPKIDGLAHTWAVAGLVTLKLSLYFAFGAVDEAPTERDICFKLLSQVACETGNKIGPVLDTFMIPGVAIALVKPLRTTLGVQNPLLNNGMFVTKDSSSVFIAQGTGVDCRTLATKIRFHIFNAAASPAAITCTNGADPV